MSRSLWLLRNFVLPFPTSVQSVGLWWGFIDSVAQNMCMNCLFAFQCLLCWISLMSYTFHCSGLMSPLLRLFLGVFPVHCEWDCFHAFFPSKVVMSMQKGRWLSMLAWNPVTSLHPFTVSVGLLEYSLDFGRNMSIHLQPSCFNMKYEHLSTNFLF